MPENLLRIELRFTAPLRIPLSMDNVKLVDSDGREIEHAFLDLPLPSADSRRVTVLLDPGRVKSGVGPNLALGRALRAGSVVTLVVESPALARPIRKTWKVTPSDSEAPRPALWTFREPRQGTRDQIEIHLDAPLSSTAENLIAIRGPDGQRVAGAGRLERGETVWRFIPARPWGRGIYAVVTHPELEDPAGNRPCAPFEAVAASRVRCDTERRKSSSRSRVQIDGISGQAPKVHWALVVWCLRHFRQPIEGASLGSRWSTRRRNDVRCRTRGTRSLSRRKLLGPRCC